MDTTTMPRFPPTTEGSDQSTGEGNPLAGNDRARPARCRQTISLGVKNNEQLHVLLG